MTILDFYKNVLEPVLAGVGIGYIVFEVRDLVRGRERIDK